MASAHDLPVRRTARYYTKGAEAAPREVWFCLHGYGQLAAAFIEEFEVLAGEGRLFVAPEALSRFYLTGGAGPVGASWMTREARREEIEDYVPYLDLVYAAVLGGLDPADVRVHALGFSQGAATAFRWAAEGASRLDQLTLWGGGVPPDVDLEAKRERLSRPRLRLVAGDRDTALPPERRTRDVARLEQAGLSHELLSFAGGHRLDRDLLRELSEAGPGG